MATRDRKPTPEKEKKKRVARKPRVSRKTTEDGKGSKPLLRAEDYYAVRATRPRRGNPGWTPTQQDADEVEKLAKVGMLSKNIAAALGISNETWCVKRREYPDLQHALERGYREHESKHLVALDKVAENGMPGGVQASIFKLKSIHRYRDNESIEDSNGTTRTQDNIAETILAALRRIKG